MSVETNQDIAALREEAIELGIKPGNTGAAKLQEKIDAKLAEIASQQAERKAVKEQAKDLLSDKIKVVIEHREGDDYKITDQFFGRSSMKTGVREQVLIQFGEEVEISKGMYEHIKSLGGYAKKFKMVTDPESGEKKKEWYDKWVNRFIVSKV